MTHVYFVRATNSRQPHPETVYGEFGDAEAVARALVLKHDAEVVIRRSDGAEWAPVHHPTRQRRILGFEQIAWPYWFSS